MNAPTSRGLKQQCGGHRIVVIVRLVGKMESGAGCHGALLGTMRPCQAASKLIQSVLASGMAASKLRLPLVTSVLTSKDHFWAGGAGG